VAVSPVPTAKQKGSILSFFLSHTQLSSAFKKTNKKTNKTIREKKTKEVVAFKSRRYNGVIAQSNNLKGKSNQLNHLKKKATNKSESNFVFLDNANLVFTYLCRNVA
jgi:hypothetical protein